MRSLTALVLALLAFGLTACIGQKLASPAYIKEISIAARQSDFQPSEIKVKAGSRVKLIVNNNDIEHGLTIPDLGLTALKVTARKQVLEFTPQQPGTYAFQCNVQCGLGHDRMTGVLTVE